MEPPIPDFEPSAWSFPEWLQAHMVPDGCFARAYNRLGDARRALIKSLIARHFVLNPPKGTLHTGRTDRFGLLERSSVCGPAPFALLLTDAGIDAPALFLASLLPALCARVPEVLAVRLGKRRDVPDSLLVACELSGQERLATLESFKKGEIVVLVATDVAARGLDIVELPAVINYDLPYNAEDYVHRIGRTGRAGASGLALSLMTGEDERYLADIEKLLGRKLDAERLEVAASPRSRDRERHEPGHERRARSPRGAGPARPRESLHTAVAGYSNDPFFFEPYVPAASVADVEAPVAAPERASARLQRRPVAALLGGGKKH